LETVGTPEEAADEEEDESKLDDDEEAITAEMVSTSASEDDVIVGTLFCGFLLLRGFDEGVLGVLGAFFVGDDEGVVKRVS
jgi:hypothetical protein